MTVFPPAWIPLVILVIAGASSTWRVVQLKNRGVNAIVVQGGSDLRALLERLFGTIVVGTTLFCVAFAVHRSIAAQLGDIGLLEVPALAWCGVFLGAGGATLVAFAQFDMGASWRIGVPRNEANPLVTQSLYRVSRNPIYLGMLIALAGIFLIAAGGVQSRVQEQQHGARRQKTKMHKQKLRRVPASPRRFSSLSSSFPPLPRLLGV